MRVNDSVRSWIAREGVLRADALTIVACSGGADSTALLHALAAALEGKALLAVYVDHQLRAGTDAEAELVARHAAALGAGFLRAAVDVSPRGNRLARAREARYAALIAIARERGARWIAVGHTLTDQAETVAFHEERGDLRASLAGMPRRRILESGIELVRPLIDVTRADTHAFCAMQQLPFASDPSNADERRSRTRLRASIAGTPREAELHSQSLRVTAEVADLDRRALDLGDVNALDVHAVAAAGEDLVLRLLRRAGLHDAGLRHARAVIALATRAHGSRSLDLGGGLIAERAYQRLRLGAARAPFAEEQIAVAALGENAWPVGAVVLAGEVALPSDLVLRNLRAGDRLRTRAGRRKLHDVLIDNKVPRALRRAIPLLARAGQGEVLWLGVSVGGVDPDSVAGVAGLSARWDSGELHLTTKTTKERGALETIT